MTSRVLIGERNTGASGVFVSPPGVDVLTAPVSSLTLNISDEIAQLIMIGRVSGTSATVILGLSRSPMVFFRSLQTFTGGVGYPGGPVRPSPFFDPSQNSTCVINSNGASMSITCPIGNSSYIVYRKAYA